MCRVFFWLLVYHGMYYSRHATALISEDREYDKDAEDHEFEIRINMEWER